jgi:hypothetical protein
VYLLCINGVGGWRYCYKRVNTYQRYANNIAEGNIMKRALPFGGYRRGAAFFLAGLALINLDVLAGHTGNYVVKYDAQTTAEYQQKWGNIYGPLELAAGGSLSVSQQEIVVSAVPFRVGADFSVFDHLKYIAISTETFQMPEHGSLEFSVEIVAQTPGTEPDRLIRGCYGAAFSYQSPADPCDMPYQQTVLEGQQAGVVLNMINFETGQLFDWFISGNKAFALIERLPTVVTGSPGTGLDLAYTQIIKETDIQPGKKQRVAIRYSRGPDESFVEYFLNGELFARVDNVGIPLDKQGVPYTGYAPSTGEGEALKDRLNGFVIGHGLFSLLDAYPYQHPEAPQLSVSIPMSERLFGQGAVGRWSKFKVQQKVH